MLPEGWKAWRFEEGAFSGAISGAITGAACAGLGALGGAAGNFVRCGTALGKAVKGTAAVTKVLSIGMGGFDTLAMADRYFGSGNIAALNSKLHESKAYNIFQTGVTAVAIFTGGMTTTMKCFVAGTLVLTVNGLVAIEAIKQGDIVYAANADTLKVSPRRVLETFVRETSHLVHLTVNGETIVSTFDHPYYVKGKGFVNACDLWIGAELVDNNGHEHLVDQLYREDLDESSVKVFNFKVEDYHTYLVGGTSILVHNANYPSYMNEDGSLKPNTEYTTGEYDYKYKTDSQGRIKTVYTDKLHRKTHSGRLRHSANTPDKLSTDHAGHIIADEFGGSPKLDNIVSQDGMLNTHEYRNMERSWSQALKNNQKVTDVKVKLEYSSGSRRPSSYKVSYKIDGRQHRHTFLN